MSEGGRERERDRNREGGCWVREMGGAALLRNAKHRISSIVKKKHRDADKLWEWGREKGEEKERRAGRSVAREGRSIACHNRKVLLISLKSK